MKTNIFVKSLLKKKNKILSIDQLRKIYQQIDLEWFTNSKFYKQIYYVKNKWVLLSLKKDLFYVKSPQKDFFLDEIIDENYRKVLKRSLQEKYASNYFIWWIKSLEIWNNNFEIPDKILIVNPYKRSEEVLFTDKYVSNIMYSIKWEGAEKSFRIYKKHTERLHVDWISFFVANYEMSLLDSLYSLPVDQEKYVIELIKRNIRKNHKRIVLENFEYFLKLWKFWSSIRRIYDISMWIRPDFAEKVRDILKRRYYF